MAETTIFTRATPSKIRLTEQYSYQMEVSTNPSTELQNPPTGNIEIILPYDGEKYFTPQSIKDIEEQTSNVWEQQQVNARVGFLGFTNISKTDLKKTLKANFVSQDFLPLDIPIQSKQQAFIGPDALRNDKHSCQITFDYIAEQPEVIPLQVKVDIYDEDTIQGTAHEELIKKVPTQANFIKGVFLSFQISLTLPGNVVGNKEEILPQLDYECTYESKKDKSTGLQKSNPKKTSSSKKKEKGKPYPGESGDSVKPILTKMSLEWPLSGASSNIQQQVELSIEKNRKAPTINYNPIHGVIEWGDITFESTDRPTEGTGLYNFQTPIMLLFIKQPGEIYHREQLKCKIQVELPRIYSNLHLYYFDVNGKHSNKSFPIEQNTIINTEAILYLEDCFKRRIFSPYQHLQFEGVVLEEMRMIDIITLLKDQGFTDSTFQNLNQDSTKELYIVTGTRTEGRTKLNLWMVIEGTRSKTTRRKQLTGGHTYTTEKETGNMTIYMRGELQGDGARLFRVMNNIQSLLKERFRHVGTIE